MSAITVDDISQFQSRFWGIDGVSNNLAKFCKTDSRSSIKIVRDLAGWGDIFAPEAAKKAINFEKLNGTLDKVNDGFSLINLIPDVRHLGDAIYDGINKVRCYFGARNIAEDQPVTKSDVVHCIADVIEKVADFTSDSCDGVKFLHHVNVIQISEFISSTLDTANSGATMISAGKGALEHGYAIYKDRSDIEEVHNEIDHQIVDLKEKDHWANLIKNIAYFAIGFFTFLSGAAAIAMSSTFMLFLSSVALVATVASFFIKENANQMQHSLHGRIGNQI